MAASNIVKVDASGLQPQATAVPGGLEVQFLENGVPVGTPTLLPAPDGAVVVDPEITPLTHGGFVVTWLDAESHAQTANFAVFDAAGALVTDQVVSPGFATDVEAAALPNGGFVLLDAQGDLFGQSATLSYEVLNAHGDVRTPLTVLEHQTASGGLAYTDIEGSYAHGHVQVSFDAAGAEQTLSFNPHAHEHGDLNPFLEALASLGHGELAGLFDLFASLRHESPFS